MTSRARRTDPSNALAGGVQADREDRARRLARDGEDDGPPVGVPHLRLVPKARDLDVVRPARVRRARERVASGFYDRQRVRETLLDVLLEELTRR